MRRALLPAVLLALLLVMALLVASALGRPAPTAALDGAARVEQVDTSAYPTVTLYVSVRDEAGQLRSGLSSTDFTVLEDGAPVELATFGGAGAGPVTSVLVVDRSGSMEDDRKLEGAREAALAFIALMRPGDTAALIAFDSDVELIQDFTADPVALSAAVERLRPDGGTALYDAVLAGTELLQEAAGRRLLVVLSDGQDCREPNGCPVTAGSRSTLTEAITAAQVAGQPVAVVGLGERTGGDGFDEQVLQRIGAETGGRYLYAPRGDELAGLYAGLADAVQQEYQLSYVSPRPFYDGTRRDIRVQVGSVTAAAGYTERHLINVVASPWVGRVLLTPLAALLIVPGLRRARRGAGAMLGGQANAADPELALSAGLAGAASVAEPARAAGASATLLEPARAALPPVGGAAETPGLVGERCTACEAKLRPGAMFCPACGATQTAAEVRRTFCDMCGRPLTAGAKFCMTCGEAVVERGRAP
jgi:Ca-activated chloride channel homolog